MTKGSDPSWRGYKTADLSELIGRTLCEISVDRDEDEITFKTTDGHLFRMLHEQDCCENVTIEDIAGDLDDLLFSTILQAEVVTSRERPPERPAPSYEEDSETWTFYKLGTLKGRVTLRWYGASNGYYSEEVSFLQILPKVAQG